jgi:hypothetical protein
MLIKSSKKELPKLKKKLTKIFNEFIRLRDHEMQGGKCISCGKIGNQAGHYFSTSQCPQPSMIFNERNVNLQCSHCNCWLHGNLHDYRLALNKKWGYDVVAELDIQRSFKSNPWTRFEYEVMIKEYTKKLADLKNQ